MGINITHFKQAFFIITFISFFGIIYLRYEDSKFFDNPLSPEILYKIDKKAFEIQKMIYQQYGNKIVVPIIPSEKIPDNLYGLTTIDKIGNITILLNKNRFKENEEYMIDYVLPHEYAHAMMFYFKDFSEKDGGHTPRWERFCKSINGKKCERFVDYKDILFQKIH
jgi:hypothetical protein